MRIYKPIGSKERLVEIFQNVNKLKLNEGSFEEGDPNLIANTILDKTYEKLKYNELDVKHTNSEESGDETFIELMCVDKQIGDSIKFRFKMLTTEGDQEGISNVNNTTLNAFLFDSADGENKIEMGEDELVEFNQNYGKELFDVVTKYNVNIGEPIETSVQEAIDLIDAIKQDSYPFGGSPDGMQTGSGYADQKPTNTSVRVKSPELDSFIQEDMNSMIQNLPGPSGAKPLYPQAADLGVTNQYILRQSLWKEIGVELLDILPSAKPNTFWLIFRFEGQKYKGLIKKNYGNAMKVVNGIKKRLDADSMIPMQEVDKPAMKLIQQALGGATAGGVKQLEERMKLPIVGGVGMGVSEVQMVGTETLGEPKPINPSTKSPVDDLPPEKRKIIMDAINSLTRFKPDFAPSADQINNEILRLRNQPSAVGEGEEIEDADADAEIKRFYKEKEQGSQHPEQISTTTEEEPIPEIELSPEDIKLIYQAEANLMTKNSRNPNYSPTTDEIRAEMNNIKGIKKPIKKFRGASKEGEYYLTEESALINVDDVAARGLEKVFDTISPEHDIKKQIILAADELVNVDLGVRRFQITPEQYKSLVKTVALSMYADYMSATGINEDAEKGEYPDPIGKKFKPKKRYPHKKKKFDTTVKLTEDEMFDGPDLTGEKLLEKNYEGLRSYDSFVNLSDAYISLLELGKVYRNDQKVQTALANIRDMIAQYCNMAEVPVSPENVQNFFENTLKEEVDYEDDDIANLPPVPSGQGGKSAAKRDMGGMIEPVEEPLMEDDNMPLEPKSDKEMTDRLLGYKSHNVGEEINEVEDVFGRLGDIMRPEKRNENRSKTFKIGEYAVGGIIQVNIIGGIIQIKALDYNTKQPVKSKQMPLTATNAIDDFLHDLTSSYYAGKIIDWIIGNA